MSWYLGVLRKYAAFGGPARRKEFWMFSVVNAIILVVLTFIQRIIARTGQGGILNIASIYQLAVRIPVLAVGARRMHDTDHSGWWLFVPIANLVFALTEGTRGDNRFGPDPKVGSQSA